MSEDAIGDVARGAARRLVPDFGDRVEMDVEAALYARDGEGSAERYDPVSVGILIVAIATFAFEVYSRHQDKKQTSPDVLERTIRTEVRREFEMTPQNARVTEVVIKEIVERNHGSL